MGALVMLALLCAGGTESENYSWYEGSVVMTNGQVLVNEMAVVYSHETLLIKRKKGRNVIPAHKIVSFSYYDPEKKAHRNYKVIAENRRGIKCYKFYELLSKGKAQVLRRIQLNSSYRNNINYKASRIWSKNRDDEELAVYDYYVYMNDQVIPLNKFKKKILPILMKNHTKPLKKLIKDRRLNLESLGHRVVVIMYYNLLEDEDLVADLTSTRSE